VNLGLIGHGRRGGFNLGLGELGGCRELEFPLIWLEGGKGLYRGVNIMYW